MCQPWRCKASCAKPPKTLTWLQKLTMKQPLNALATDISACRICAERFRKTHTAHKPRPVVWFQSSARILIAGQAPGARVHASGKPFDDRSGDRLRDWMGVTSDTFYDTNRIAILPMAFCFPGYNAKGSDLPPPPICARTWRKRSMETLSRIRLTLLIGGYAQSWHLGLPRSAKVSDTVRNWAEHLPDAVPLPHPSWRNTGWLKKNPWFERDLLPVLRNRVQESLS